MFFFFYFIECGIRVELNWKHDFHYLKHIGHLNPGPHPSSVLPVFTVQMNRPRKASIPNEPRRRFSGSNRTEHNTQTHFTSCIHNPEFIIKSTQISSVEVQTLTSSRVSLSVQQPTDNPDHSQRAGQALRNTRNSSSLLPLACMGVNKA